MTTNLSEVRATEDPVGLRFLHEKSFFFCSKSVFHMRLCLNIVTETLIGHEEKNMFSTKACLGHD